MKKRKTCGHLWCTRALLWEWYHGVQNKLITQAWTPVETHSHYVSWIFATSLNEKTTLGFKNLICTFNFKSRAKTAPEQSLHLLLHMDQNIACSHKKATCIITAYTLCNQLGCSTQNRVKMMEARIWSK